MSAHGTPPYFTERARQSLRTLGYGAMAFPLLSNLPVSDSVVALTMTAFVLPSMWNLVASHRERNGDVLPSAFACQIGREERRELGTVTFRRLLDKWKAELPFEDLITQAAICSNNFGRRLCVIYVRVPNLPRVMNELLANLLRLHIRNTDEVKIVSDGEFIVCAPLLRDTLAAKIIYQRLARTIHSADLPTACSEAHLGKAIYPMDGYTGAELIRHARIVSQVVG